MFFFLYFYRNNAFIWIEKTARVCIFDDFRLLIYKCTSCVYNIKKKRFKIIAMYRRVELSAHGVTLKNRRVIFSLCLVVLINASSSLSHVYLSRVKWLRIKSFFFFKIKYFLFCKHRGTVISVFVYLPLYYIYYARVCVRKSCVKKKKNVIIL